jgi:hypothetical protein
MFHLFFFIAMKAETNVTISWLTTVRACSEQSTGSIVPLRKLETSIDIGATTEPTSGYLIHHKKYKYNPALEHQACQKPTPFHCYRKDF